MLDTKNTNIFNRFICSFFICFLTTILFAQSTSNIVLEKVPAEELTNNLIKAIQQDEKGFLWFGTDEGVFKYDGYSFKAFKNFPGDAQTISNNKIEFFFSENNLLWIGSWGGLSCIDINSEKIKNFPADEPLQVYAISPENDSVFWIGTSTGLFQFNKKSFAWKRISSIDKNVFIRSICDDKKNHLYITTHNGFFCFDKLTQTCKHYSIPSSENEKGLFQIIHKSMMDIAGNIWMTTWNAGLIEFNPQTKKINQYF